MTRGRIDITDSHCHLDSEAFAGEVPDVVKRAQEAGVTRMVTICTRLKHEPAVRAIAEAHACVHYAAGAHPSWTGEDPAASVEELLALAAHPKFVAIGETGLDYFRAPDTAQAQQASLRVHIEAARQSGLPLIIHTRDADEDMARILREESRSGEFGCVLHCFSSGAALARAALDLGCYLSMSGIAAFPRNQELRDIFAAAPLERILVETDAPYLAPPPHRGKRNEPAFTVFTAEVGAGVFGVDLPEFAARTQENFDRLFAKAAGKAADA